MSTTTVLNTAPENVIDAPFLIDDTPTREDLAPYYNEVTRYDHFIGKVVDELEAQGELDNILIFVPADNGRPFPRAFRRRFCAPVKQHRAKW